VATRIAGNTELVQSDRNGLLVPPGDADALASALERLIRDDSLRQQLSSQGRAGVLAQGMTRAQMIEEHRALYASLLGET
jgi:glycosyltransferase involved in cell wall biosynthesis